MRPISEMTEAARNAITTPCATSPNAVSPRNKPARRQPNALPDHWVAALFARFQSRFMHRWTSAMDGIEETAVREWANRLAGLTPAQLEHGLNTWREKWPPSVEEYRDACLGSSHPSHRLFPPALPRPKAQADIVHAEIAKMRARPQLSPTEIDALRAQLCGRGDA